MSYSIPSDNECCGSCSGNQSATNNQSPIAPLSSSASITAVATPNLAQGTTSITPTPGNSSSAHVSDIPPNVVMLEGMSEGVDETGSVVTVRIEP
eukprot:gnl/Chilomastix_caulleri/3494.p2 GENE.gnl/Chilomastix_caulleri/3494~~gnl/Chilomastix_caulleri/3494.p2  ORF type:complete len:95 (+),score=29.90 gnl/Chilomastix_caulleri/3494:163-447(+)